MQEETKQTQGEHANSTQESQGELDTRTSEL